MREIAKFKIKERKSELWFWVCVYETAENLRLDAGDFKPHEDYAGCIGLCQPYEIVHIKGKRVEKDGNIGVIRILRSAGSEVASHEVLHAALWNYRVKYGHGSADFGKQCSAKEEKFAHLFGQLFRNLVAKMYKFELWK